MAKQTKTLADVQTVTTVNDDQLIPITDASGNVVKVSLANLKTALLGGMDLNAIYDGVFILYHRKSDSYPLASNLSKWPSLQDSGEIADGVMVETGEKNIVVSPTESYIPWSRAEVNAGGNTTTSLRAAIQDWAGETNTKAQITHVECQTESYAAGFCSLYERVNVNGEGFSAGKWWLPSLGELMLIYANFLKINFALSLINNALLMTEGGYWSSTEAGINGAWYLDFNKGVASYNNKATTTLRVRPVSMLMK